jgi:sporulation protein YlmC with PRC-barrel domain
MKQKNGGKMKRSLTIAVCLSTSLLAGSLYADHEAEVKVKTDKKYHTELKNGAQCSAKHLLNAQVKDNTGAKIGQIEDLVIDPASQRVQFAVVRLNEDIARGNARYTPIPMAALRPDPAMRTTETPGTFLLTVDRSKVESASRFNVERWPTTQGTLNLGPDVYSHYGMTWDATGAPSADVRVQTGTEDYRGLEYKDTIEPPIDFREKSPDNGTAPDGKTTFPFLHEQTDQD